MAKKPERKDFPPGLLGNRKYQLAVEAYNNPNKTAGSIVRQSLAIGSQPRKGKGGGGTSSSSSSSKIDSSKYDMDSEPPKGKNQVQPAEKKPAKPPVRASEQRTTTISSSTRQSAPAKRDTRNDEYNRLRIKANKSGSAEDRKAAESEGMKAWRKANPKLAAELDRKEAEKRRKRDKGKSGAVRAGWDGNKNY